MTYCCNNIQRAYELIGNAKNILDTNISFSGGDGFLTGITAGIYGAAKATKNANEANSRMTNAYNVLCEARNALNACSCVSMYKYNELVDKLNNLGSSSVDKSGYDKLWSEYSKNIDDYNRLSRNTVSKEAFDKLISESKKNIEDYNNLVNNSVRKEAYERLENEYKKNIKDYNELVGEQRTLAERAKNLTDKYNKLVDDFNDKVTDYQDMKEKYDDTKEELHSEKLGHANKMGDEKLKHLGEKSQLQIQNTKLQEKLEAANSEKIDLRKRLKDKEVENDRLLIKLDDKNNQLTVLRLESGKKDNELERKSEEIKNLKNQAKSSDKRAESSQEELLNEKIRSEKGNLELFATELTIGLEQINSLSRYHERLLQARKNHNQANIETHENNITRIKEEFQDAEISIVNIQEICRKCERLAEFRWELEQKQNQYQAQQEQPTK